MPGRLFIDRPLREVVDRLSLGLDLNEGERLNIKPGENLWALTPENALSQHRWGMIPVGRKNARGRPVLEPIVNARSETVFEKSVYEKTGRAIVPVSGWYEWTGEARRKTPWRIARKDGELLAFAAITDRWTAPGGLVIDQVATVTCEPNRDIAPIHHRMGVLLDPADFDTWLSGSEEAAARLCRPLRDGLLRIEKANPALFTG